MLEFAFVMRDYLSVASSVRVGARVASTGAGAGPGTCPGAPVICVPSNVPALAQAAADAIQQAGTAMPQNLIDNIWVYKANASGFPGAARRRSRQPPAAPTASCSAGTTRSAGSCTRAAPGTPRTINACINSAQAQSVGVMMRATHPYLTGFFGSTISAA